MDKPLYIAGIGASAGGLEALQTLLDHTPPDSGIAFVIVQHLSPNHKSFMAELLSKHTAMEVVEIENNLLVQPNTVYVMPPKHNLSILEDKLFLTPVLERKKFNMPIDIFLNSLAVDQGQRALGIILSGTGRDGSKGIEHIKHRGGIVFAQQASNAKFDGMPKSAISTGFVDFVFTAERIGRELNSIIQAKSKDLTPLFSDMSREQLDLDLLTILSILKKNIQVDFTTYKRSSILRRLEKRMGANRIYTTSEYIQYLQNVPDEIQKLKKDLLIGVTAFFRDCEAFDTIEKKIIPQIFEHKKEEKEIRIWSAACSTGEEAYSLAIMLMEYMERHKVVYKIKIFATDLDELAIHAASQGIFSETAVQSLPVEILNRYFLKIHNQYQVKDIIRKVVVFAQHNILKNPPFINLDLITCRNLLIYLKPEAQQKLMSMFHFALNQKGFLFLGSSETVGKSRLFEPINRKWSIYQYRPSNKLFRSNVLEFDENITSRLIISRKKNVSPSKSSSNSYDHIGKAILKEYVSPIAVIDENYQMIHSSGSINQIIRIPQGEPTNHILKMVPEDLAIAVRAAIHKVRRENIDVCYHDIRINVHEKSLHMTLRAKPFQYNGQVNLVILYFEEIEPKSAHYRMEEHFDSNNDLVKRIDELELELQHTKEYLQITKEELETSSEELQSTNEELIAANEELQSSNEELQSLNEELMTVNNDYQEKIEQLTELTDDMDNLFVSTEIGTLFLDKNLCIRRFTPSITKEINLLEVDYGRPLRHISHNFKYGSIVSDAKHVLENSHMIEKEIENLDGKWYSMKVLPYISKKKKPEGVVLTFHDITELKNLNVNLELFSHAIEQSPVSIAIFSVNGHIEYVNPRMATLTGYRQEELLGRTLDSLYPKEEKQKHEGIWNRVKSGKQWTGEIENAKKNGESYWEAVSILPITDDTGSIIHYLRITENITERKKTESLLLESEMLSAVGQLAAGIAHEIRNPLTALKGFTKLISSGNVNSGYTDIMESELDRINSIVSELLFLSKPRAVEFEDRNIIAIIKEVISLLETQAIMKNITIVMDLETEKYVVRCVEHQLKQVLINLVKNAIEAVSDGGKVTIRAELMDESIMVAIQDEGCGIPEKILSKIGQPFFTTKEHGTGLGLMVSQKIIQNHGGKMTIKSIVNKGTTLRIIL